MAGLGSIDVNIVYLLLKVSIHPRGRQESTFKQPSPTQDTLLFSGLGVFGCHILRFDGVEGDEGGGLRKTGGHNDGEPVSISIRLSVPPYDHYYYCAKRATKTNSTVQQSNRSRSQRVPASNRSQLRICLSDSLSLVRQSLPHLRH